MYMIEGLEARRLFATGGLDPTFFGDGTGTITFGNRSLDTVFGSAVQPDGKIVLVGSTDSPDGNGTDIAVARLNPDATLDQTFGITLANGPGGGLFEIPLPTNTDTAFGVVIQPDGKIVIVGSVAQIDSTLGLQFGQAVVIRLTASGGPDDSFGTNLPEGETGGLGFVFLPLSTDPNTELPNSEARAVTLQSTGKIVIGGAADLTVGGTSSFAIARLNTDGSLDRSFGDSGTGIETEPVPGFFTAVLGIATTADDRVVLTGTAIRPSDALNPAIGVFVTARLTATGRTDFSFGDEGAVITLFPVSEGETVLPLATSVVIQPDGKTLVGGFIIRGISLSGIGVSIGGFALARYNFDGSPDLSFGGGTGRVETYFGGEDNPKANIFSNQVVLTGGGKFYVAGKAGALLTDETTGSAVARYNADGTLDRSFSRDGILVLLNDSEIRPASSPGGGFNDAARSAGAQVAEVPGGGIYILASRNDQITAARLIADGPDLVTAVTGVRGGNFRGGTKATASIRMSNQGSVRFSGTVPITLRLSRDAGFSGDDALMTTVSSRVTLSPGQTRAVTVRYAYPLGASVDGTFFVVATANEGRGVTEGSFVNNSSASSVTVVVAPAFIDLGADFLSGPTATTRPGKKATFSIRLTNSGNITASGSVMLQLLASTDETASGDDLILLGARQTRVSLRPGQRVIRFTVTLPKNQPTGTYTLILKLDASALGGRNPVRQGIVGNGFTVE